MMHTKPAAMLPLRLALLCLVLLLFSQALWGQGISARVDTPDDRDDAAEEAVNIPPFGANLFSGGFRTLRTTGLNQSYQIMPGDQITVRAWGALELDEVLSVDLAGNIFIPQVGPVFVQGLNAGNLNQQVEQAIGEVFIDNVSVYTNLDGVQPIAVFVTGFVRQPGRYAGSPSDSPLNFLDQAGGIDPASGSFRRIQVQRQGQEIASIDLYRFLLQGEMPQVQFQDGDTVVVGRRGAMVTVTGEVAAPHRYELISAESTVEALLQWVSLNPGVSHGLFSGTRNPGGAFEDYLTLADLRRQRVRAGDELMFARDQRDPVILVEVEGRFFGPSRFTVPRDAHLMELLDSIAVDPALADVGSVSIKRQRVAERQRASLEDSLRRLETTFLGASSSTVAEAEIRAKEAELIQNFVTRARQIEPNGRLIVAEGGEIRDVLLQDGDIITIPERSDSVFVTGEVLVPQAMVYRPNQRVKDYIDRAGGLSRHADRNSILLARQSGEVVPAENQTLKPGDEILVLPKVSVKNLELAKTLTQILYQMAIAARVVLDISAAGQL
ncbi:SLBB domain-containing protein [Lamprobacter modestohalophilus]|uniref:polysaccharide biosynthesis/export family protein n=1 Tax=Lamprobacter modestohalophilus TaxID=1064514 RepID=UPI002ADEE00A|nr:polysaccharide biosynthesis/export family protein [Lamprobacter modestohalophilus]MEA1052151.1 SLBB domain-containing protein [Lamprobacter modestohalophilus]